MTASEGFKSRRGVQTPLENRLPIPQAGLNPCERNARADVVVWGVGKAVYIIGSTICFVTFLLSR